MSSTVRLLIFLSALFLMSGCASSNKAVRVLWPVPPEDPKLEFLGAHSSELDFERSYNKGLTKVVIGENPLHTFKSPFGIVSDGEGRVYVSDLHAHNIRVYDFNQKTVKYLSPSPIFRTPLGLALDSRNNLYVADGALSAIRVFSPEGVMIKTFGEPSLFENPAYIAINETLERIYVSDSKGHQIVVFDLGGKHLFSFGEQGRAPGNFYSPQGLAIDMEGHLFVADRLNARIQVFDSDGNFLRTFGQRGDRWDQFEAPKDLAFDSEGNLYIVDQKRSAFYTYSPNGDVLLVTGGDPRNAGPLSFATPVSLHIDKNDRIFVADMVFKRFSVWQYLNSSYLAEHPIRQEDLERIKELQLKNASKN